MRKLLKHKLNLLILFFLFLFFLCALCAPLLAASKPLVVQFDGHWYFPLFRYLLYPGYYTKPLDRFFNLLMLATPILLLLPKRRLVLSLSALVLTCLFLYLEWNPVKNPTWSQANYTEINRLVDYTIMKDQQERTLQYLPAYHALFEKRKGKSVPMDPSLLPTLWNEQKAWLDLPWLESNVSRIQHLVMPLLRPYHWEEDRGGNQLLNEVVPWYELSRINRKDLSAALIFGTRISLVVGFVTVLIALLIGIPFGATAGYYGGKWDIILSRFLEVWEAMPVLFMLLMIVAITEAKSIFWIILAIGIFGWTGFARYVRAETLRVKRLAFVEASRTIGYGNFHILFSHILPNSLSAVLVLIPFAILGSITAESGLSFLGLGEEGSCSLGVLMDEGRTNFPAESYLLWPPAVVLSLLLIAIALLNDAIRDALDPRLE